ncbi:MAG: hypothetical protein CMI90_01275 [Pelagibacteraceae bacterium]|nr:hypothetical protein [Pelagibacteraceae bacterium]
MNKFKKNISLLAILLFFLISFGCSKQTFYSGISENSYKYLYDNYENNKFNKSEIINLIGPPTVKELDGDLWVYNSLKEKGNETFRKIIYRKTIKLYFKDSVLYKVVEINI